MSPSLVVSVLALCAVSAVAYASPGSEDSVRSKHIVEGAVRSSDIRNGSIKQVDLAPGATGVSFSKVLGADPLDQENTVVSASDSFGIRAQTTAAGTCLPIQLLNKAKTLWLSLANGKFVQVAPNTTTDLAAAGASTDFNLAASDGSEAANGHIGTAQIAADRCAASGTIDLDKTG